MQEFDRISIETLNLTKRTYHALVRSGVFTVSKLKGYLHDGKLERIRHIGPKSLEEISNALAELPKYHPLDDQEEPNSSKRHASEQANDIEKEILKDEGLDIREQSVKVDSLPISWAEMVQSYFEGEKSNYIHVLISRFGFKPKKMEEIAIELGVTRERVRQIQESVALRFLRFLQFPSTGFSNSTIFLNQIQKIFLDYGESLSLVTFKKLLQKENLLGQFSKTFMSERLEEVDLLETLICWLNLLTNKRYTLQPLVFPVDIRDLVRSGAASIKDRASLSKISPKDRRKINRKVLFTGGITIKETIKIISTDEKIAVLVLESLNLQKKDQEWFSFKNIDKDNNKIPLKVAGLKMLTVTPEIDISSFHDGLRRHASRFYPSIAPMHVIEQILPILGFRVKDSKVSSQLTTKGILSQSEKSLISAIRKNGGIASFLEIAEEFFIQKLSLPAVSVTLKRSPIVEKVDEGLYKLRGTDIIWQQIETAKNRQKRFSQDDEVTHGLDGVVRMKFTVNSYAFLTGVVGANSINELSGSWSVVHDDKTFGEAKIDDVYLWGLNKLFKKLDVEMGDRLELALNTWNRTLSVEKVKNELP